MSLTDESFKLLSELDVDLSLINQYQILCLPENIENQSEHSNLVDWQESIILSKLLKEESAKCANSYDIGLHSKISENRSINLWFGSIWILKNTVLPLFISVVGRLLGEVIQNKLETSDKLKASEEVENLKEIKVHANLRLLDGKVSGEIKYHGDAENFLKVLHGIKDEHYTSEK